MSFARIAKHLVLPHWFALRAFPPQALRRIEEAIRASEREHDGEIRFVVESTLPFHAIFRKRSSRRRAEELFAQLGVWDTEHNTGVLIYIQLLSRHIDIVADRGIAHKVEQAEWDAICRTMEARFRKKAYLDGALEAIERITRLLARHFPARGANPNELPDKPVVL
jgi:uncharacterized membrane protein